MNIGGIMKKAVNKVVGETVESKRVNDSFMRKLIFYFGGLTITAIVSIAVLQTQFSNDKETNKILRAIEKSMQAVIIGGDHRNFLLGKVTSKVNLLETRVYEMHTEQTERGPRLTKAEEEISMLRNEISRLRGK